MTGKILGKITHAWYGKLEPYCVGLHLKIEGQNWSVCARHAYNPTVPDRQQKEEDILRATAEIEFLLEKAKVDNIEDLIGKPVECNFNLNTLSNYRILTEVL